MNAINSTVGALRRLAETRQPRVQEIPSLLGDSIGRIAVGDGSADVWVRLRGIAESRVRAVNNTVALVVDLPIIVAAVHRDSRIVRYEVVGVDPNNPYPGSNPSIFNLPSHARSHEFRANAGWDGVNVYARAFVPLRANAQVPAALTLLVQPGYYYIGGWRVLSNATTSPAFSVAASAFAVLTIDAAGAFAIVYGPASIGGFTPGLPTIPDGAIPIVGVGIVAGMTTITESNLVDVRAFLSIGGSGTGDNGSNEREWLFGAG